MHSLLGSYLKKMRKMRNLTQAAVTEDLFDRSYWSMVEQGSRVPQREVLPMLAERLSANINTIELLYPGSEYLEQFQRATRLINNELDEISEEDIKHAWTVFARVESTSDMRRCIELWSRMSSASYPFLEAIVPTVYVCTMEQQPLNDLWELFCICGNTYYLLGHFQHAAVVYRDILHKNPPISIETRVSRNLGSTLIWLGHYEEALRNFESILEDNSIDQFMMAQAHHGIFACLRNLDRTDEAYRHCQHAIDIYEPIDTFRKMQCLHALGTLTLDKFELSRARIIFRNVHSYYAEQKNTDSLAELFEEYVRIEMYKNEYELADQVATHGLRLAGTSNPTLSGQFYIWKSWAQLKLNKIDRAFDSSLAAKNLLKNRFKIVVRNMDPIHKCKWQDEFDILMNDVENSESPLMYASNQSHLVLGELGRDNLLKNQRFKESEHRVKSKTSARMGATIERIPRQRSNGHRLVRRS